jgi:hypothetical protein
MRASVDLAQPRAISGRDRFRLDRVERPQRLAQGEGDARPDLEDREVIAHQRRKRRRGLIVGRMRLEDEMVDRLDRRR